MGARTFHCRCCEKRFHLQAAHVLHRLRIGKFIIDADFFCTTRLTIYQTDSAVSRAAYLPWPVSLSTTSTVVVAVEMSVYSIVQQFARQAVVGGQIRGHIPYKAKSEVHGLKERKKCVNIRSWIRVEPIKSTKDQQHSSGIKVWVGQNGSVKSIDKYWGNCEFPHIITLRFGLSSCHKGISMKHRPRNSIWHSISFFGWVDDYVLIAFE